MSLITKVKAGSVSSLSDARYFAGMGVDWLGFDVNPSSGSFVSVELYKNMAGWVSGPKRVIENHGPVDAATIQRLQADYEPDFIEVDLDQLNKLPSGMKAFARVNLANIEMKQLVNYSKQIECLVLQIDGSPFSKSKLLQEVASHVKVLLNISPDFQESQKAIRELPITGIALTGSKELKVGVKSYDYSEILELLDDES